MTNYNGKRLGFMGVVVLLTADILLTAATHLTRDKNRIFWVFQEN